MTIIRNKNHALSCFVDETRHMAHPVVPRKAVLTPNPDACTRVTLGKGRPKGAWGLGGRGVGILTAKV